MEYIVKSKNIHRVKIKDQVLLDINLNSEWEISTIRWEENYPDEIDITFKKKKENKNE